jgi:MFS family permease
MTSPVNTASATLTAQEEPAGLASCRKRLALTAMLFAVGMTFIDQTIVAIASPSIQAHLALTRPGTQWAVNAYLLALAATFALGGRLADVFGPRRMVVLGILGFAGASAACGATPTGAAAEAWLITFRTLQGVSAAIMVPAAVAVVVASFPIDERGRAMAVFFTISGALTAIGPIAGGYLTAWTWRSIFWINLPIAALALALTAAAHLPKTSRPERIDVRGAVLVAGGMGLSVLGLEQAPRWGWASPATWLCILGGLLLLAGFAVLEARTTSPLIKVRIFVDRSFRVDNAVLFFSMIAFVPVFFFASVYAQVSLGYDANRASLYLLLIFAGFAPAAQIGGRMLDRSGPRRPMVIGSALGCLGFALWANTAQDLSLDAQWPFVVMAGAGIGLLLGPASTDAVNHAIGATYGEVTGITQTIRNYAATLGMAVLGTVLTTVFADRLTTSLTRLGLSPHRAAGIAHEAALGGGSVASAAPRDLQPGIATAVAHDFATGFTGVLIGMAIALGLSFLAAVRYPRNPSRNRER